MQLLIIWLEGKLRNDSQFSLSVTKEENHDLHAAYPGSTIPILRAFESKTKQTDIAMILNRHKSTTSREIQHNIGSRGYRPQQAQRLAHERRLRKARPLICSSTWSNIRRLLRQECSPEQISLCLSAEQGIAVSHGSIYQYILQNKAFGGDLYRHLRCQNQRRKRYVSYNRRGQLVDRVSIVELPSIVDTCSRIGGWELSGIIGKGHQQAIVSLTKLKSRYALLHKVERKTAQYVSDAIIRLLSLLSEQVITLTSDNGKEFADHKKIANTLDAQFYFAHPYASWERGLNENTNGLIRQYFSKSRGFNTITQKEIK